jgi:hypothetical protein
VQRAIARTGDIGPGRRLAASVMIAQALLIAGVYLGLGMEWFAHDTLSWALAPIPTGLLVYAAWTRTASRRRDAWIADLGHGLIAAVIAGVLVIYVVAKIYGGQFGPPLEVELDTKLRDLTGFQLTWRFFGYSFAYAMFVAAGQGVGAALLCFARTRLLGACLLAPIMANIAVINFTHQIPVRLLSAILLALDLYLIAALGGRRLIAFFTGGDVAPRPHGPIRWSRAAIKAALLAAYFTLTCVQFAAMRDSWWRPSPIHGTWDVIEVRRGDGGDQAIADWQRIYFENYRHKDRHVGSARSPEGQVWFRYDVDGASIRIALPMRELAGTIARDGASMTIRGELGDRPIAIELRRVEP